MRKKLRCVAITICLVTIWVTLHAGVTSDSAHNSEPPITPVVGESWLNHLHRSFGDTSMGKTGRLGPPAPESGGDPVGRQLGVVAASDGEGVILHGSDLYRLNCRECHGEAGLGAPPEINSVINPVRATSAVLVMERMKKTGMDISSASAAELARQAQDSLLQRIQHGGKDMPASPYLSNAEIRALTEYLRQLAGVPGSAQLTVKESPDRVGELIVKSTCHICHDAAGVNPTPEQLENGAIPPLSVLTTRVDELELIRKVTSGAPIVMGTPPTAHRGRMPVFYYLSSQEVADVYLYLTEYPPSQLASAGLAMALSESRPATGSSHPPPASGNSSRPQAHARNPLTALNSPGPTDMYFMVALTLSLAGLAVIGFGSARYGISRLSKRRTRRSMCTPSTATGDLERELQIW